MTPGEPCPRCAPLEAAAFHARHGREAMPCFLHALSLGTGLRRRAGESRRAFARRVARTNPTFSRAVARCRGGEE